MAKKLTAKEILKDKIPPQNPQAEASLIGALLMDKDAIIKVADIVHSGDFYVDKNGLIFDAIVKLNMASNL